MTDLISREIQLVSRPQGMPTAANFALVQTKLELLKDELFETHKEEEVL